MSYMSRLNRDFQKAPRLELSDASRYIFMSDCHRGNGTANDNFLKNRNILIQEAASTLMVSPASKSAAASFP